MMGDTYRPLPTLVVMGVVLLLAVVRAQPGSPPPTRDIDTERTHAFRKAVEYERVWLYDAAVQTLEALPRGRVDYLLDLRLGWLHYLQGNHAVACRYYDQARIAAPQALEPRVGILLPLLAQQRYAEAEQTARAVLANAPDHYLAALRLTIAYRMQTKVEAATLLNRRMLELYPTDVEFLLEQARTLSAGGATEEARRHYRALLLLVPDHPVAQTALRESEGERRP